MKTTVNIHADSGDIPAVTIRRLPSGTFSVVIEIGSDEVTLFLTLEQLGFLGDHMDDAVGEAMAKEAARLAENRAIRGADMKE